MGAHNLFGPVIKISIHHARKIKTKNVHVQRNFLNLRIFFLDHGQFHLKGSMDLALERRDEGDPFIDASELDTAAQFQAGQHKNPAQNSLSRDPPFDVRNARNRDDSSITVYLPTHCQKSISVSTAWRTPGLLVPNQP